MPLDNEGKRRALAAIYGEGTTVALFIGDREVSTPGYARQPVEWSEPVNDRVSNVNELRFGPFRDDVSAVVGDWVVFDSDMRLGYAQLDPERPRQPYRGDVLILPAGVLIGVLS